MSPQQIDNNLRNFRKEARKDYEYYSKSEDRRYRVSKQTIALIKRDLNIGLRQTFIANTHGVSNQLVSKIYRGVTHASVKAAK